MTFNETFEISLFKLGKELQYQFFESPIQIKSNKRSRFVGSVISDRFITLRRLRDLSSSLHNKCKSLGKGYRLEKAS